jgi:hypothetical protein
MMFRKYAPAAAAALVAFALFLLWLWQPERQVRLHTSHFLKKVERRNWNAAGAFLASDYSDRWNHDRDSALANAREAFRLFLFVTIENRTDSCEMAPESATARTVIKISGNGGPGAQLVMERVNTVQGPFTFAWRKASWKPWDWRLTSVEHPELRTERVGGF